jgi:RimJ/RimL family protein N-acetyltransferase
MSFDAWAGERIRMRAMSVEDVDDILEHSRDSEVQKMSSGSMQFPASAEGLRTWIEQANKALDSEEPNLLIETADGVLVGGIHPHHCDPRQGTFSYGITIFREHWRKGYASEAVTLLLDHFFGQRRYQKCTVSAYSFNRPSMDLHRALGFTEEGRLRRMVFADGQHHDEVFFGITAEEHLQRHGSR